MTWRDNKPVVCASTAFGAKPTVSSKRFDRSKKKHVQLPCTKMVTAYNKTMGEVDRSDQNISFYRSQIRGKSGTFLSCFTSSICQWLTRGCYIRPPQRLN